MQDGKAAEFSHLDCHFNIGHGIHSRSYYRNIKRKIGYLKLGGGLVGINRDISGHDGYFVEAVSSS